MLYVYQQKTLQTNRTSRNRAATRPNRMEGCFVVCKIKVLSS